jgi:hypothetical protein
MEDACAVLIIVVTSGGNQQHVESPFAAGMPVYSILFALFDSHASGR